MVVKLVDTIERGELKWIKKTESPLLSVWDQKYTFDSVSRDCNIIKEGCVQFSNVFIQSAVTKHLPNCIMNYSKSFTFYSNFA